MLSVNLLEAVRERCDRESRAGAAVLYVSSSFRGEGKTTAAVQTACGLARDGRYKVLLVDASTAAPALHRVFQCSNRSGLTDLLYGGAAPLETVLPTDVRNLSLMPHGRGPGDAPPAFSEPRQRERFDRLRHDYDVIVLDGETILDTPAAVQTAACADGILLVVRCEHTKWEVVDQVLKKAAKRGTPVLGIILNRRKFYIPRLLYGKI